MASWGHLDEPDSFEASNIDQVTVSQRTNDILNIVQRVYDSGMHNYAGLRIPLATK